MVTADQAGLDDCRNQAACRQPGTVGSIRQPVVAEVDISSNDGLSSLRLRSELLNQLQLEGDSPPIWSSLAFSHS